MYEDIPVTEKPTQIVMEEVTDPEELAKARTHNGRAFDRNTAWLQAHAARGVSALSWQMYLYCR